MRLTMKKAEIRRISMSNLYLISLVATMLFLLVQKNDILNKIDFFSEAHLKTVRYQLEQPSKSLFILIIQRLKCIATMFVLSTTYIGCFYVYSSVIWFGISSGFLVTIVMMRYGLKGILLLTAGLFPHYLIYVPAIILTMILSKEKRSVNGKFVSQFMVIAFVIVIGCALESFINPGIVAKILKKY